MRPKVRTHRGGRDWATSSQRYIAARLRRGCQALGAFAGLGLGWGQLEGVEVADAAAEDEVAGGEDVGAAEVEEEEELGAPAAEAADGGDRRDHFIVGEAPEGGEVESAVFDPSRQVADVFDLAAGEADRAQVGVARRQDDGRS